MTSNISLVLFLQNRNLTNKLSEKQPTFCRAKKLNMMLYTKKKETKKKRSYAYLHKHASVDQVRRLHKIGRVMLNGKPKEAII